MKKKQVEDTYLSQAVEAVQDTAAYDANVKYLLADKQILARILKYTIGEFQDMEIPQIIGCIGDEIQVSSVRLDPGLTNLGRVTEDKTEDNVPGEGMICYDVRFHARLAEEEMKLLVNLEAQRLTGRGALGYHLENRIVYYIARMISAQKNTEFYGEDYDGMKNVRSIWICMNSGREGDSIEEISLERRTVFGKKRDSRRLRQMQGIIVNIRNNWKGETSENTLIAMLETLLSKMEVKKKKEILEKEYGMVMTREIEGRIQKMCNFSEFILEEGWNKGMAQGIARGILQSIMDILEELGDIPADIRDRICAEDNPETLRVWLRAAAKTESLSEFRKILA